MFFDNKSSEFHKQILEMLMFHEMCFLVCDKALNIISLTSGAKKMLNVDSTDNLNEILSRRVCKGISLVYETKVPASFVDSIDDAIFDVEVSCFDDNLIVKLENDNHQNAAILALCDYKFTNFVATSTTIMNKLQKTLDTSSSDYELFLMERYNLAKLSWFYLQIKQLLNNNSAKIYALDTENLTKTIGDIISDIKENVPNCDIEFSFTNQIICDFSKDEIEVMMVSLIKNVFEHCGISTKICINLSEKNDRIHISIKDSGCGFDLSNFEELCKIKSIDSYKDIPNSNIGFPVVRKIANHHSGVFFASSVLQKGTEINIIFPKFMSNIDYLSSNLVIETNDNILRIIKTLAGFDNFKCVF